MLLDDRYYWSVIEHTTQCDIIELYSLLSLVPIRSVIKLCREEIKKSSRFKHTNTSHISHWAFYYEHLERIDIIDQVMNRLYPMIWLSCVLKGSLVCYLWSICGKRPRFWNLMHPPYTLSLSCPSYSKFSQLSYEPGCSSELWCRKCATWLWNKYVLFFSKTLFYTHIQRHTAAAGIECYKTMWMILFQKAVMSRITKM